MMVECMKTNGKITKCRVKEILLRLATGVMKEIVEKQQTFIAHKCGNEYLFPNS